MTDRTPHPARGCLLAIPAGAACWALIALAATIIARRWT